MNELAFRLGEMAQDEGIYYSQLLEAMALLIEDLADIAEKDDEVIAIHKKVLALALELKKHEV